jgi:hypothetical protein
MILCVQTAMKNAKFGTDDLSPCNIFLVNEAEAQAMTALTDKVKELKVFHCRSYACSTLAELHTGWRSVCPC